MPSEIYEEIHAILSKVQLKIQKELTYNDIKTLQLKSIHLSFSEKVNLLLKYNLPIGTFFYDGAGLFDATLRINNNKKSSKPCPLAYIEFTDGMQSCVAVIDILESVRNDATLIGHPAIVFAIHHWQEIIRWSKYAAYEKFNEEIDDTDNETNVDKTELITYLRRSIKELELKLNHIVDERWSTENDLKQLRKRWVVLANKFKYEIVGNDIESAKKNLTAIGNALLQGARRNAINNPSALAMHIQELNLDSKQTFLYVAWERLKLKYIDQTKNLREIIEDIENHLKYLTSEEALKSTTNSSFEIPNYEFTSSNVTLSSVIDFLKTDGSKFVGQDENAILKRPSWKVFKNAYVRWRFNKSPVTLEKTPKQTGFSTPYSFGNGISASVNLYDFMRDIYTRPLHTFCPTIVSPSIEVDSIDFLDRIPQPGMK